MPEALWCHVSPQLQNLSIGSEVFSVRGRASGQGTLLGGVDCPAQDEAGVLRGNLAVAIDIQDRVHGQ